LARPGCRRPTWRNHQQAHAARTGGNWCIKNREHRPRDTIRREDDQLPYLGDAQAEATGVSNGPRAFGQCPIFPARCVPREHLKPESVTVERAKVDVTQDQRQQSPQRMPGITSKCQARNIRLFSPAQSWNARGCVTVAGASPAAGPPAPQASVSLSIKSGIGG
jgi:hypothetical protein